MELTAVARIDEATVEVPLVGLQEEHRPAELGETPAPVDRLYVLDLLRLGAALVVMGHHLIATQNAVWGADPGELFTAPVRQVFRYGWMGVQLFFIISGFVICMSAWGRRLPDFFTSRVVRLMPAYGFAVLVTATVLFLWPLQGTKPAEPFQVLSNLTMLHKLQLMRDLDWSYWTLIVELKFYLLFAVIVAWGLTYRRVVLFCMLYTTTSLVAVGSGSTLLTTLLEPKYTSLFVAGITLFLMHRFGQTPLLWAMVVMSWLLSAKGLLIDVQAQQKLYGAHAISGLKALALLTAFFIVMIGAALGWFSWLRSRFLVTLGALTYPLYLLHHKIGRVVIQEFRDMVPHWVLIALIFAGMLVLAWLVHRFVERPLARRGKVWLRQSFEHIRARS